MVHLALAKCKMILQIDTKEEAEAMYETAKENINDLKLKARILETQLKLEYGEKN